MSNIRYLTDRAYEGPWLLDMKALKEFDLIIATHWNTLEDRRKALIDEDVDSEAKKHRKSGEGLTKEVKERLEFIRQTHKYSKSIRLFQIYSDVSVFRCESFDKAIRAPELSAELPVSATVKIESANVECNIVLESNKLHIKVKPEDSEVSQSLFFELNGWVDRHEPKLWQRLWGRLADAGVRFYGIFSAILLALSLSISFFQGIGLSSEIQAQAQNLLNNGISETETPLALELILKTQVLNRLSLVFPHWLKVLLLMAVVVFIMLPIRPKIVLGIGKGVRRLQMWKLWHRAVIAIWIFILTYFVGPSVASFLSYVINSL